MSDNTKMYDYSKLKGRIYEKFGSLSAFIDKIDISSVAFYNKLGNKNDITRHDMTLWGELLEIDVSEYGAYFFVPKG